MSASSAAHHTTADVGSLHTLRRSTHLTPHLTSHLALRIASHRTSHHIASHFAHRIALHRISQSLRSIYRSFIHTQARLFAPAGGGFNAFRRRASTCSKSLRRPGELQLPSPFSPQCFGCGGMLQQNAVCNFHPSAFRQSSLMDRAGTHHRRTGPTINVHLNSESNLKCTNDLNQTIQSIMKPTMAM